MSVSTPVMPAVVVMAYNRPHSLQRLLDSLLRATYPDGVPLVISIDKSDTHTVQQLAEAFVWPFGEIEVIIHPQNLGLRAHSLSCGDLTERYPYLIFLEDDIFVSPDFYQYALEAIRYYGDHARIGGVSLYSFQYYEQAALPFVPLQEDSAVYFLQFFASWGTILFRDCWQKFRAWYQQGPQITPNDLLPVGVKKYWSEKSWSKYFLKFLVEHDLYYVYPRISHCTNFSDAGEHYAHITAKYQVALPLDSVREFRFKPFEESHGVYDVFFELLPDRLNRLVPELADYDYVVDLNATKEMHLYPQPYVLSTRKATESIKTYSYQLTPAVMNVIYQLPGQAISLVRKEHLIKKGGKQNTLYYHDYLTVSQLLALLRLKLKKFSFSKIARYWSAGQ